MLKAINTRSKVLILGTTLLLCGCNSQQKKTEKQDEQFRQQVEQLKKKSHAYPANGSNANHYVP